MIEREWCWKDATYQVQVVRPETFRQEHPQLWQLSPIQKGIGQQQFCCAGYYRNILYGTFVIPDKKDPSSRHDTFAFCLENGILYFIDSEDTVLKMLEAMQSSEGIRLSTPLNFLLDFMEYMVNEDIYMLQDYELKLTGIEEELNKGRMSVSNEIFSCMRKDLNVFSAYYEELSNVGETLEEIAVQDEDHMAQSLLSLYVSRVKQLNNMTRYVKENLSQVLDLKQAINTAKQNNYMNLLAIVTSIFTPLTFITGWYGMNFKYFPMINDTWGFWVNTAFCLLIFAGELWVLNKWKIFRK